MKKVKFREKISGLIQNNKLEEAINLVQEVSAKSAIPQLKDDVSLLVNRFKEIRKSKNSQFITYEAYMIERARLSKSLLNIANLYSEEIKEEFIPEKDKKIRFTLKDFFRNRVIRTSLLFFLILSSLYWINFLEPTLFKAIKNFDSFLIIAIFFTVILICYQGIVLYLNLDEGWEVDKDKALIGQLEFQEQLQRDFSQIIFLEPRDKKLLFDKINEQLSQEVIDTFEEKGNKELKVEKRYNQIIENFLNIEERINSEVRSLNKKANVNLAIGVVTTFITVIFLIFLSINDSYEFKDWLTFLTFYIPKLTLVIFIELFSFYFLKLYRSNLNEIQYYQNEMTDIDFRIIALKTGLLSEDEDNLKFILGELLKVNHNPIIKKDESSIELEKYKNENQLHKDYFEKLLPFLNFKEYITTTNEKKTISDK